jgi:hypothetical protein
MMPFIAKCPFCRQKSRVTDALRESSIQCPRCGLSFPAAAAESVSKTAGTATSASGDSKPSAAPAEAPVALATPANAVLQALQTQAAAFSTPIRAARRPDSPFKSPIPATAAVTLILGAAALLAASQPSFTVLTRPLSAIGVVLGCIVVRATRKSAITARLIAIGGTLFSGLMFFVSILAPSLLGPVYQASRATVGHSPQTIRAVPLELGGAAEALEIDGWADASRAALQQDSIRVRVTGVAVGPIQLAVPQGFSKESYVSVSILVQHLGHGQHVDYVRWGALGVRETTLPKLKQGGQMLRHQSLEAEVPVGQVRQGHRLAPGKAVEDLLLFDGRISLNEPLQLELPADAWGGRGNMRFHVPISMVKTRAVPSKVK